MPATPTTRRDLLVLPSAGEGIGTAIPPDLTTYCNLLQLTQPVQYARTGNLVLDGVQLHLIALAKGASVDPSLWGITTDWIPRFFHSVDPVDPKIWAGVFTGVIYSVRMSDATSWFLCVREST